MLRSVLSRIATKPAPLLVALLLVVLMAGTALSAPGALSSVFAPAATPPTLVSYQGYVEVSGNAYTGTGNFQFAIVDAATGDGTILWSTTETLTVSNGLFDFMLGSTTPLPSNVFDGDPRYLRVWFDGTALEPNQRIGSAPYALRAEHAITADIAVGVGNNTNPCTAALAGNLRWTGSVYQFCDGFSWRTVQLSDGKVVLYQANNAIAIAGGSIGGRTGADTLCQSASNKPAGYSNYRAFISVNATDEIRDMPTNYGVPTLYPVRSTNNTLIANNWADLLDGTIATTLGVAGVYVNGPYDWWSGSLQDGSLDGVNHCASWTNLGAPGRYGRFDYSNNYWITVNVSGCSAPSNLLCIAY
jgi:hypothetical protein